MKVSRQDFAWAASAGLLTEEQAESLWEAFRQRSQARGSFDLANVAYYFGALVVIGAMGWFMTLAWERFGGLGIFSIASFYVAAFAWGGRSLWRHETFKVPGGLLMTMAVCMTPLAIYGLERAVGIWPQGDPGAYRNYHIWVKGSWLLMEVGTIAAGLIALKFIRFPFLTAPIAYTLWYMSMDLTPLLVGRTAFTWDERLTVSLWFGAVMLAGAYVIDRRTKEDYAFWGYLFGLMAFWLGMSLMTSDSEWGKFTYFLVNLTLMACSVLLQRPVFIVFGSVGVFGYVGYLAHTVFKDSLLFPFALTALGIGVIVAGIQYQRHHLTIEQRLIGLIPPSLRRLLPRERDARP